MNKLKMTLVAFAAVGFLAQAPAFAEDMKLSADQCTQCATQCKEGKLVEGVTVPEGTVKLTDADCASCSTCAAPAAADAAPAEAAPATDAHH